MTVTLKAPAKINLGLRIIGKREDGFHDIHSIFQTVGLYDELSLADAESTSLTCDNPAVPCGDDNLVMRAKKRIEAETGSSANIALTLKKRIPMGAGLGGGSADAAVALRGIADFMGSVLPENILMQNAAMLGSDIPFLVRGGTALVSGRGESMIPVNWPFDFTYVIVFPGFGVSTAWAYGSIEGYPGDGGSYKAMTDSLLAGSLSRDEFFDALVSDFEAVVFKAHPELSKIRDSFLTHGAVKSIMTGSGASIIGIFDDSASAKDCETAMRSRYTDVFRVKATQ